MEKSNIDFPGPRTGGNDRTGGVRPRGHRHTDGFTATHSDYEADGAGEL